MTPEETNDLLVNVATSDKLIDNDDFTLTAWQTALAAVDYRQAAMIAVNYYANREPGGRSITPGYIRRQAATDNERGASKRAALERSDRDSGDYKRSPNAWRSRNPHEWDRLVTQGRDEHRERLRQQGIPLKPWQELETLHGPQDRVLS